MTVPLFLPWLRRGLARAVGEADGLEGPLPLQGSVAAKVPLVDSRGASRAAEVVLPLAGPGDVVGLDPAQVVRTVPPDGAADVETGTFPFVELAAPDLPWLFTPAAPTPDQQRLRPWLVLVCVEEREGTTYDGAARPLPVLRVPVAELPDLAESWAWAHVQSLVPVGQVDEAVTEGTGAVIARLLCPRRLLEGRRYRAALVPAFAVDGTAVVPAWPPADGAAQAALPVYLTWTFTTGVEPGDFEQLARRLEPDVAGGRMGFRPATVDDAGLLPPRAGPPPRFEYEGALVDPGAEGDALKGPAATWFENGMRPLLDRGAVRPSVPRRPPPDYDPEVDDPVVAPPLYGSYAAGRYDVSGQGWLAELNLDPRRRAAAGLGARVVRDHQDALLAAAWDQVGEVRALQDELNRSRLAAEVGRSHGRRLAALGDPALLLAGARLHVYVPDAAEPGPDAGALGTVARRVRRSAIVPTGLVAPTLRRLTRPGSVLSRRAGRPQGQPPVGVRALRQFVRASRAGEERPPPVEALARFGAAFVLHGALTTAATFRIVPVATPLEENQTAVEARNVLAPVASRVADDLSEAGAAVRAALDPMPHAVARLATRVRGVTLDLAAALPTRVPVGPRFPDPLFTWLQALGSDLVVPGIDELAMDRARLLGVNEAWVAAFLAAASHEWAREALWQEYPADLGATAFSTFWPRVPPGATDLARDVHDWPRGESLAQQVGAGGSSTVLVVRGEVIRRYPDTELLLVEPGPDGELVDADGDLPPERTHWPDFTGPLDPSTVLVGFDVDAEVVRAEGWYVAVQEPAAGPRFGLDQPGEGDYGEAPATWAGLTWAHVVRGPAALEALAHVGVAAPDWLHTTDGDRGLEWGRNAAHLAGITFQPPFRLLLPAAYLMPSR